MGVTEHNSDKPDRKGESVKKRKERLLECVKKHWPNISSACNEAGLSRETYYQYLRTDKKFAQAVRDRDEALIDKAESVVNKALDNGDTKVAMWLLEKKAKDRGYGDKLEVTGPNSGPIEIVWKETIVTRKET